MSLTLAIAVYVIIWWVVLFAVLPFGVLTQQEAGEIVPGTPESAPVKPEILFKIGLTTVISAFVFVVIYLAIEHNFLDLDRVPVGF